MKKIVHIVESFGGGVFSYLVDLTNNTCDKYDITIVYSLREQTPKDFKTYFKKNIKFIKTEHLHREINFKEELKAIKEIKKIVKNINPDIVHLHSTKAGMIGRIAVNNKNIKLFYTPHGFSFLMENTSKIKKKIYWLLEKIAALRKCKIVCCSYGEYQKALKLSKNATYINNGIDVKKINKEIANLPKKEIDFKNLKICTIGRIDYQKNPILFNLIANDLNRYEFTWIGDGNMKDTLTSKNIKITGWKTRKEVLEILNENDVFILPSLWEGLPISLLEAMYMEKICIVSNVIGNKDVIKNSKTGFIAYNNDYATIIQSLDEKISEKIIKYAKRDVEENYNWENNAKKYIEIYEN